MVPTRTNYVPPGTYLDYERQPRLLRLDWAQSISGGRNYRNQQRIYEPD